MMINPFAKQINDHLQNILQVANQLYLEVESDLDQLEKLQKGMKPTDSSVLELLQAEQTCSEGILQIQQITQQIQQQLQHEYDPQHAVSKWNE